MNVRVSVNYSDIRWKRIDLISSVSLLVSKVVQLRQMKLNGCSLSILACSDSEIRELNRKYRGMRIDRRNKLVTILLYNLDAKSEKPYPKKSN